MKTIKYFILSVFLLAGLAGCKKGQEADYDDNFHPRIIDNGAVFTSPNRIIFQGQSAIFNGLTFSPKPIAKTKVSWKVNGTEVSTDTAFTFTPTAGGEYQVKLEATYNGQTSTRISNVLVSPATYTLKNPAHVSLAYLSENGTAGNIDWANVTHVAYNCAKVTPDGLDITRGEQNQITDELVARAHINGIPAMLSVSGRMSGIDGWSLWESNDFGNAISDPIRMPALVAQIAAYVNTKRLDGVDLMMTDLSNFGERNIAATGPFLRALKAALPATAILTITVTTNWMHWGYTDLNLVNWVNVHAFEDGVISPGSPVAQPSSYDYMVAGANTWKNFHLPANKVVVGMPAFGLRFDALDANGNNLSWGSYSYVPYSAILASDKTAFSKESINMGSAQEVKTVFYNGIPLIESKADFLKTNGFKGAYLWAADYDVMGANSLMRAINEKLK